MTEPLTSRALGWDDVGALHRLMRRALLPESGTTNRHIGHFFWGLRGTPDDDVLRDMRGWFAGETLAAVAWVDPPNAPDAIVAGDDESALDAVLSWLEAGQLARSAAAVSIMADHGDARRMDVLRRRGYETTDSGNVRMRRRIEAAPEPAPLPAGFSLRHVAADDDIERRAYVETASFGGAVSAERWRMLMRRMPDYRPELDLLAVAADGTGASACTCWYDEASGVGEFEAVGTAAEFRRLGVGKAVITEGLRRLHALGAREAILYTSIGNDAALALYRSCGFAVVGEDYAWSRAL